MTKDQLRRTYREGRKQFVAGISAFESEELIGDLLGKIEPLLTPFATIGSYAPTADEIPPTAIEEAAGSPVCLPFFSDRAAPMVFRAAGLHLQPGPFGIAQPAANAPELDPDILLVPLLAATAGCVRLGQGAGHYDRYLAFRRERGDRPLAIGLAWDCQIADALPEDPWDETLDFVATPSRLYARS